MKKRSLFEEIIGARNQIGGIQNGKQFATCIDFLL